MKARDVNVCNQQVGQSALNQPIQRPRRTSALGESTQAHPRIQQYDTSHIRCSGSNMANQTPQSMHL
eukprot:1326684-Amphidinium_carterae.2